MVNALLVAGHTSASINLILTPQITAMVTSKKVQNNEAAMADGAVKEYRHGLCMDVPMYIEDSEYCGEELGTRLTCRHGLTPKRRTAWEGPDTGRRFLDNNTSTARRRNPGKRGRHGRKLPILSVKPRELTIASSPHKFVTMVRSLNPLQTAAMEKIGFGGLLAMPEININRVICIWLADRYDVKSQTILIQDKSLPITLWDVQCILDIPAEGPVISKLPPLITEDYKIYSRYKDGESKNISLISLQEAILEESKQSEINEEDFIRRMMFFTIGYILCPTTKAHVSSSYLPLLRDVTKIHTINWASLTREHLCDCLKEFKGGLKNIEGNLPLLQCWYWEHVKAVNSEFCNINYNGRQIPLISFWNAANIIEQIEHPDFLNDEQRYEHDTHGFEDRENDFYINEQRIEEDTAFEELENDYPILSDNEEIDAQQSFAYVNDHMPYGHIKVLVDMLQQLERSIQFMENKLTNKLLSVEQICRKNTLAIEDIKNTLYKKRKSVPIQADAFRPKQEADVNKVEDNRTFDLGNERMPTITEEMHEDNTDETNLAKEIDGNGTEEAPFIVTGDEATETDDNNKTIAERLRGQFGRTVIEAYTELINDNQQGHTRQYGSALIEKETQVQVFLPINRDKSHWYVIVINARCQEIQILDSMQMQPQWYNASEDIKNLINGVAKYIDYTVKERLVPTSWTDTNVAKWPLCPKSVPQQKDSWSCGLNALKFMETWDGKELTSDFLNMLGSDKKYRISSMIGEHSHGFVSPDKRHLLRSNRTVSERAKSTLFSCHKASIGTSQAFRLLQVSDGGFQNVGCTLRNLQNYYHDLRCKIKDADAQMFVGQLERKKEVNPAFFYEFMVDKQGRLVRVFWADAICRKNYSVFGDVLSVDSTYSTNQYNMKFVPFTGVNHHLQSVFLGASFLADEKIESFVWLFQTFLKATGGVAPRLIITDEDASMKAAIAQILPNTVHRLCMWHIMEKVPEKVGPSIREDGEFWDRLHKCVWGSEDSDDFESEWNSIMAKYGLIGNEWFSTKV
ncbi:hypothetical protein OsI_10136 [Oryza sativa Indica Group]|uniref:Ubiquitin-like protease family profile domain-containing protein n=1 Tax=Oryza sativa subsp. indica TaxID=39946 RepID=B8ANW6_ORYSI|nr:hypothetical protein OsI_10136 [Oryza sativa Indica Group]